MVQSRESKNNAAKLINRHISKAEKTIQEFQDKVKDCEFLTIAMQLEAYGDATMEAETALRNWLMIYDEFQKTSRLSEFKIWLVVNAKIWKKRHFNNAHGIFGHYHSSSSPVRVAREVAEAKATIQFIIDVEDLVEFMEEE